MILQYREDAIEEAKATGLPDFIQTMVASFYGAQVVEGNVVSDYIPS